MRHEFTLRFRASVVVLAGLAAVLSTVCAAQPGRRLESPPSRSLVTIIRVKPEMINEWLDLQKNSVVPELKKAAVKTRTVYSSGIFGNAFEYIIIQPMMKFAEFDAAEPQAAVVEGDLAGITLSQRIDVDDAGRPHHVELHQVEQRRAAGDEAHVRTLLRSFRPRGGRYRRRGICRPNEFEGLHGDRSRSRLNVFASLLDRGDDIGVGPAPANVTAHQLFHGRVVRSARFLKQGHGRHDLAGRAISTLISVGANECRLHGMQCVGCAEALDGGDLFPVVHQGQAKA